MEEIRLGIDFGTTKTVASMWLSSGDEPEIIKLSDKEYSMPSRISINTKSPEKLNFGENAIEKTDEVLLVSLKRCFFCDMAFKMGNYIPLSSCFNKKNYFTRWCEEGKRGFTIGQFMWRPRELYRAFIEEVLTRTKAHLDQDMRLIDTNWTISELKLTFPVLLYRVGPRLGGFIEEYLTQTAKKIFGHAIAKGVKPVVEEPSAALMAQWETVEPIKPGNGMIIDIGGGTTDLLLFRKMVGEEIKIIKKDSLNLGGDDYDKIIENLMLASKDLHNEEILNFEKQARLIKETKNFNIWDGTTRLTTKNGKLKKLSINTSELRKRFLQQSKQITDNIRKFFDYIDLSPSQVRTVLLSGGGNSLDSLREEIKKIFQKAEEFSDIHVETTFLRHFNDDAKLIAPSIGASLPIQIYQQRITEHKLPVNIVLVVENYEKLAPLEKREKKEILIYESKLKLKKEEIKKCKVRWKKIKVYLMTEDPRKLERKRLKTKVYAPKKSKSKKEIIVKYSINYNGRLLVEVKFGSLSKKIYDSFPMQTGIVY